MRSAVLCLGVLPAAMLAVSGCADAPKLTPPDVPADLRPPPGQMLFLRARASGVQIYQCTSKLTQPPTYEWVFRGPEATLMDRSGRSVGRHYAGPTWQSRDGSSVVGEVKVSQPAPEPTTAIPWLLLAAKATAGSGVLSGTTSIQRVHTLGGLPPSTACGASNAGRVARVAYTATYYFYRAAR
jgi:hypothetical protein